MREAVPELDLPRDPITSPSSQWMLWSLSSEDTLRLVRRCRREQVSVNSVLLAAVFCAVRESIGMRGRSFRFHSPFNVREQLHAPHGPVQLHDVGCFMSNMNGFLLGDLTGGVWEVARCAQTDIDDFTAMRGPAFGYNMTSLLFGLTTIGRRLRLPARWLLPREERVSLLTTNYGIAPLRSAYGSLRPRACTLMFENDGVGAYMVVEGLVLGQELNVGFAASGLTSSAWEGLHRAVRCQLFEAAGRATSAMQAEAAG